MYLKGEWRVIKATTGGRPAALSQKFGPQNQKGGGRLIEIKDKQLGILYVFIKISTRRFSISLLN